ncbi:HlyD family secretion protein [Clostridium kluyveri]|uniref:HlyD family secretion protein n=1 Tax=Clostridium kluyveri TaxID=1534 RepID=UPI00224756A2|nr:efflux RND transporter periplasmic adaptor subunit [Clostridium kluyveri]UZQ49020.1 efflux RND transporter periplasmic adaptor subunit [Clostridium kluyveri]
MKNKLKNMKPVIIFTVILIGLSIFFVIKNTMDKSSNEFQFSGTVEADELNTSSEISGKIKDIKVEEGTKVKSGDIIAVLDSDENTINVNQANISLENAENELGKVNDGTRVEEINAQEELVKQSESLVTQGEAALETSQNNLNNAQTNYDYKKKIYDDHLTLNEKGYESNENLDKYKNDLDNAQTALNNAKSALSSANAQLKSYKAQLAAATDKLNLLVNSATARDEATAKYGIDQAEQNIALSKIAFEKSNIKASSDGIVETVNFKKGEYVSLGSPIITLLDSNNMYIKIYVPEKILPYVKLNKEVTMKSDFIKDKVIKGKVSYISKEAEFTPMNIVTKEDRMKLVYEVKIKISDNLEAVKSGMLLDVTLK